MINKILDFFVPGKVKDLFKSVQEFMAGKKTYLAGAIIVLEALIMLVEQFAGMKGVAEFTAAVKNFAANDGIIRLAEGLAVFGIRAALPSKKKI